MASAPVDERRYPLQRNTLASIRLNYNHFWMKSLAGYLLHPKILPDAPQFRLADIGTGTGIWASEVAAEFHNCKIDAVDISDEQFPPIPFRNANIAFWTHDCFEPFSEDYVGQFDVVNIKFLLCIVNDNVADMLLENVLTLLKPGGYLQWFEPRPYHVRKRGRLDIPTPACDRMLEVWKKPSPHSTYNWVHTLPDLLRRHGLQVITEDIHHNPEHYMQIVAQTTHLGQLEFKPDDPEVKKLRQMLQEEYKAGTMIDVPWGCVVARKVDTSEQRQVVP